MRERSSWRAGMVRMEEVIGIRVGLFNRKEQGAPNKAEVAM